MSWVGSGGIFRMSNWRGTRTGRSPPRLTSESIIVGIGPMGRKSPSVGTRQSIPRDRLMRGSLDAREYAIAAAINFLLTHRMQGGWWRDFSRIDPGEEYVSAFVATALAETSNDEAHEAAHWTWQLLSHRQHPMDGWAWNAISPPRHR